MAYCWIHALTGAVDLIPSHIKDIREVLNQGAGAKNVWQPIRLAVIPSLVETMEAIIGMVHSAEFASLQI